MEKHRRDIDGLRAIAVLSVIIFHAGVPSLSGGYVGVDVFFVISGFLITKYVFQEIQKSSFSIVEFYERRVRRIMPALFFLLLVSAGLGYFLLLPKELYSLSKHEVAATLFAPNILLYREAGYFDSSAKLKPLLHLWSLGVEEQFYIFLPLTMLVAYRRGRRGIIAVLCSAFVLSFGSGVVAVRHYPNAAFYLVPFRAWELLLGSLLAVGVFPTTADARLRHALSAVGMGLILISLFAFSSETPFPGAAALLPCLGTALVIYANETGPTWVGNILSSKPLVSIGLISYSLYLWHWPLLVFGEQFMGRPLTHLETAFVVALSFIAATVSWKFVEQPFRRKLVGASRPSLFSGFAVASTAVIIVGAFGVVGRGLPQRLPSQALQFALGKSDREWQSSACTSTVQRLQKGDMCRFGASSTGPIDFVVWGDSHADAMAPTFRALAEETHASGWLAAAPGCAPLLGVTRGDAPGCDQFNENVIALIERQKIHTVFLIGRWEVNALGRTNWERSEGLHGVFLQDASSKQISITENLAVFQRGLTRTFSRLSTDRNVVLVMDVPNTAVDTPSFLAKSAMRHNIEAKREVRIDVTAHGGRLNAVDSLLTRFSKEWHAITVDPKMFLCAGSDCLIAKNGRSLYRDDHHLSSFGALQLVDLLRPTFDEALSIVPSAPPGVATLQFKGASNRPPGFF